MTKEHWEDYKQYIQSLSSKTLKKMQDDRGFRLKNAPHKLVNIHQAEKELDIISNVIKENHGR